MARSEPTGQHETAHVPVRADLRSGPEPLNEIERRILDFMVHYLRTNTYQPSIREIGERFGIKSTKTVSEHLQALDDKGHLERDPSRSRGVKILGVDLDPQTVSVPCFEELPADRSELRSDRADVRLSIDRRLAGGKGAFFVRARPGDLDVMGVAGGDYVLVEPNTVAEIENGAIVVARVGTGAWYHRLARNGSGVSLEPLQSGVEPTIIQDTSSLFLLGRVIALYRRIDEKAGALNLTHH